MVAGCASQSAPTESAATPAAQAAAGQDQELLDAIREATKRGYKIVNQNGETLYCKEDTKTGTRVRSTITCLNEAQLRAIQQNSQRNVEQIQRTGNDRNMRGG